VLAGHAAAVTDLLWSHDGRILVTAAYDHNIKVSSFFRHTKRSFPRKAIVHLLIT
jgi:WD40 repeat protein